MQAIQASSAASAAPNGVPHHVAVVMDGNGRWATQRLLPRLAGHKKGLDTLKTVIEHAGKRGVAVLTVFAFSSENFARPADEVSGLMKLLMEGIAHELPKLHRGGVAVRFVGSREHLSPGVVQAMQEGEALTQANTRMLLNVCFAYGGRWDLVQAANQLVQKALQAKNGTETATHTAASDASGITEADLSQHLALAHCPDPDLFIRTGGEQRLSNFLLWQSAYAELYFSNALWPDFGPQQLDDALADFAQRQRRFGKV